MQQGYYKFVSELLSSNNVVMSSLVAVYRLAATTCSILLHCFADAATTLLLMPVKLQFITALSLHYV